MLKLLASDQVKNTLSLVCLMLSAYFLADPEKAGQSTLLTGWLLLVLSFVLPLLPYLLRRLSGAGKK